MGVDRELPFTSLQTVIFTTGLFLLLWAFLKSRVEKRGSFRWAEDLLEIHNFITAGLSLTLAAYVADIGHDILLAKTGIAIRASLLGYLYHLLKFYEYVDVILAVLTGTTQINKYTAFSHVFMPYWSYYRIIARPDNSYDWRFQVIADCLARFFSRAIPWLVADLKTEETLLNLSDEIRWYPDLAITGFWALFTLQGQRESEQAIKSFGHPYKDELTARLLSVAILLYASYVRRQEMNDKAESKVQRSKDSKTTSNNALAPSNSTTIPRSQRQKPKRNR